VLFKLKLGQPRSKALLRHLEDPEMRKLMDKAELDFYKDTDGKVALVALKEELYFTIEERSHEADLTELGRATT
jgi:preprotein translocase subunit SecA